MPERTFEEIWTESLEEGERQGDLDREPGGGGALGRSWPALIATGFAGGADVMLGIIAVTVATAGLSAVMPASTAHVLASLLFGLAFVFITLGRAELLTENFLILVGAVFADRSSTLMLVRMWATTLVLNFVGLAVLGALASVKSVLPPGSLHATGVILTPSATARSSRGW